MGAADDFGAVDLGGPVAFGKLGACPVAFGKLGAGPVAFGKLGAGPVPSAGATWEPLPRGATWEALRLAALGATWEALPRLAALPPSPCWGAPSPSP